MDFAGECSVIQKNVVVVLQSNYTTLYNYNLMLSIFLLSMLSFTENMFKHSLECLKFFVRGNSSFIGIYNQGYLEQLTFKDLLSKIRTHMLIKSTKTML